MTAESIAKVIAVATKGIAQPPEDWKRDVVANITGHAPTPAPECEESLPNNERLRKLCISRRRGEDVTLEDREDMERAGVYANVLREHATREAAKLCTLFGAWREFEASEIEPERECGELIRRFVRVAWRLELPDCPGLNEGRQLATRVTNNAIRGLMPDMGF